MSGSGSRNGTDGKCVKIFTEKPEREKNIWKTYA